MRYAQIVALFVWHIAVAGGVFAGDPTPEVLLPLHEERDAFTPGAAYGKDVYLLVWQSGRLAPGDIRKGLVFNGDIVGCRVDKTGKVLDAKPFVICRAKDLQEMPRVVSGGGVFLVFWQDLRNQKDWDVYAARVAPTGKVLDPDGFLVSGGPRSQAMPRATWDGKAFQMVWQDIRSGGYAIRGARVSIDGKLLDAESLLLGGGVMPAVGSSGQGQSLAIWVGYTSGTRCLLADGKLVPGSQVTQPSGNDGPSPDCKATPTAIAVGPNGYLGVWRTYRPVSRGQPYSGNQGALFAPDGARLKDISLSGEKHLSVVSSDAAWDGTGFTVAWSGYFAHDKESGKDAKAPMDRGVGPTTEKILCSRLTPDGVLTGAVVAVSGTNTSPASSPAVATDGAGVTLVAYEKHPEQSDTPITIAFRMMTAK